MKIIILWRFLALLTWMVPGITWAQDCNKADQLYNQSLGKDAPREALLSAALAACPSHVEAINNLAVIREKQKKLDEAETLYQRALHLRPRLAAAHAGLGDVYTAKQKYREAAASYQRFLGLLAADRQEGRDHPLFNHESAYQKKLADVQGKVNTETVLSSAEIVQSLTDSTVTAREKRGIRVRDKGDMRLREGLPKIDTHIRFASDSDQVQENSMEQLAQIAEALLSANLKDSLIRIEGHTDASGSTASNQKLSQQRAQQVQKLLVDRFHVVSGRLEAVGRGEEIPLAANSEPQGRALNRRVTFINLGP